MQQVVVSSLESLASRLTFPVDRFYGGSLDEVERVIACADAVLSMRLHLSHGGSTERSTDCWLGL